MLKLGDIIKHTTIPSIGLLLVVAIERHCYRVRYITGIFDGSYGYVSKYSDFIKKVGNIFDTEGGGK